LKGLQLQWPGRRVPADCSQVRACFHPLADGPAEVGIPLPRSSNLLVYGDNLLTMAALLEAYRGEIDLIYIDPPFATGKDFDAYDDQWRWDRRPGQYLQMLYDRLALMRDLLAESGSLYLHLDWRMGHYVKVVLDEIFGADNFQNCISWRREVSRGMKAHARFLGNNTDCILLYTKEAARAKWKIPRGRREVTRQEAERDYHRDELGYFTTSHRGTYSDDRIMELADQGRIYVTRGGSLIRDEAGVRASKGTIRVKYYLAQEGEKLYKSYTIDNLWDDIAGIAMRSGERVGYPTQKPVDLLKRIISISTDEGDLVADFFCGSGTTLAAGEELGRKWIGVDNSPEAVDICRQRLAELHASNCISLRCSARD